MDYQAINNSLITQQLIHYGLIIAIIVMEKSLFWYEVVAALYYTNLKGRFVTELTVRSDTVIK